MFWSQKILATKNLKSKTIVHQKMTGQNKIWNLKSEKNIKVKKNQTNVTRIRVARIHVTWTNVQNVLICLIFVCLDRRLNLGFLAVGKKEWAAGGWLCPSPYYIVPQPKNAKMSGPNVQGSQKFLKNCGNIPQKDKSKQKEDLIRTYYEEIE